MLSPRLAYLEFAAEHNKPFVAYRLPNDTNHFTIITQTEKCVAFDNLMDIANEAGFIFAPFDKKSQKALLIKPDEIFVNDRGFRGDLLLDKTIEKDVSRIRQNAEDFDSYAANFETMHSVLEKDEIKKIILSRTATFSNFCKEEQLYIYHRLTETYPAAMTYWVHLPHLGINWMGATPELLLGKHPDGLQTVALAGTKISDEDWSEKELEEQQIVADYIEKQLSDYNFIKKDRKTVNTGAVEHLANYFIIKNDDVNTFKLAEKLHPTPAICGLPKEKAKQLILVTEKHDREYYCGIVGTANIETETQLFVNLRCMKIAPSKIQLFVGGGITKDSEVRKEWTETERKANTLRSVL